MHPLHSIYHIIHIDRLASIAQSGQLSCDAVMAAQKNESFTSIGNEEIKKRRRDKTIPGTHLTVSACTPFYYCPRSVMLYTMTRQTGASPYEGPDSNILHLVVNLMEAIEHAKASKKRFFITDINAATATCQIFHDEQGLNKLDLNAIKTWSWKEPETKSKKQAEFLLENHLPWPLVKKIGTKTQEISDKVKEILAGSNHRSSVIVEKKWYY